MSWIAAASHERAFLPQVAVEQQMSANKFTYMSWIAAASHERAFLSQGAPEQADERQHIHLGPDYIVDHERTNRTQNGNFVRHLITLAYPDQKFVLIGQSWDDQIFNLSIPIQRRSLKYVALFPNHRPKQATM